MIWYVMNAGTFQSPSLIDGVGAHKSHCGLLISCAWSVVSIADGCAVAERLKNNIIQNVKSETTIVDPIYRRSVYLKSASTAVTFL